MKRNYSISVAMTTYNGEKYIKEQIDSIIKQLYDFDELVISDDGSQDRTLSIIKSYKDKRIKLLNGPKLGVKQNFANAIQNCKGKYIFLSDQDDIWMDEKIEQVLATFEKEKCMCVVHDCIVFDSKTNDIIYNSFYKHRNSGNGILKNIWKNTYIGCCMALDSKMKDFIIPIPNDIEMHDQWIGILCEKKGKSVFIDSKLIRYRRHDKNESSMTHYPIFKMISNRLKLILRLNHSI